MKVPFHSEAWRLALINKNKITLKEIVKMRRSIKYGEVISGLIHNLNTPLMGISGRLELLRFKNPGMKGLDQMTTQLEKINEILGNMANMLDGDKNFDFEKVSLKETIKEIDLFLNTIMKYKHKIQKTYKLENDVTVTALSGYLNNALYEIFINCIESLPEEEGKIEIAISENENYGVIEIKNNSEPISDDIYQQIGNPFVTNRQDALGLGIYIIRYYIERMSGKYSVTNENDGVKYRLEIPK